MTEYMTPSGLISLVRAVTWVVIWNNQRYGFGENLLRAKQFASDMPGAWILPVAKFLKDREGNDWPKGNECGWQQPDEPDRQRCHPDLLPV